MPWVIQVGWDDVPHLDAEAKAQILESYPLYERNARSRGDPMLGSGAIYPLPEEAYVCDPFELPHFWPRAYGMDVGWNKTAAVWGAWDRESDIVYCYSEHYMGQAEPQIHADAIRSRGAWIPGAIDPAAAGANQRDGTQLAVEYQSLGLILTPANNRVTGAEGGIHAVYRRLAAGKLRIFSTLHALRSELRIYRRDDNGKVVKENDHACDALRYLIMSGLTMAITEPYETEYDTQRAERSRSAITGY